MRIVSIAAGVIVGFLIYAVLLGAASLAERPISIYLLLVITLAAAGVGYITARRVAVG